MRELTPSATDRAIHRLEGALRLLEAALERRLEQAGNEDLAAEIQTLGADRSRLAEQLDQSHARAARLENLNREAARRIDDAMETIGAVLAGAKSGKA